MGAVREHGLDRAIQVFECLHEAREPLPIGEVARRLRAPRSTIYNIVNRFVEAEILETRDSDGAVFFGRTLYFYGINYLKKNDRLRRAREEIDRMAERIQETVEYGALQGNKYTTVHMYAGASVLKISSIVGERVPIPWTAVGRLLLVGKDAEEIRAFIPEEDFILPDGRTICFEEFCQDIDRARKAGFCLTTGLINSFTKCLAVPVYEDGGVPTNAICAVVAIDTPQHRIDELLVLLKKSADFLSSDIIS